MKTILAGLGLIVVLFVFALFALCNDDENDPNSWARLQIAYHDGGGYDDGECWDSYDCEGRGYGRDRYDQNYGSRDDRNRNRNRDRGAFSPGPFRDSPVTICLPYSCNSGGEQSGGNRNDDRRDEPPPDEGGRA